MASAIAREEARHLVRDGHALEAEIRGSGAADSTLPAELLQKINTWEENMKARLTRRPDFRLQFENPGPPGRWDPFTATVSAAYDRIGRQLQRLEADLRSWD